MNTQISIPEQVLVETSWYDGPREGVGNIVGVPHRFSSNFDETDDEPTGTYHVWPINKNELILEIEQWKLFVDWNNEYELGKTDTSTHPGTGGIDKRWDEIETLLKQSRRNIPSSAKLARAEFVRIEDRNRYDYSGPDYMLVWNML